MPRQTKVVLSVACVLFLSLMMDVAWRSQNTGESVLELNAVSQVMPDANEEEHIALAEAMLEFAEGMDVVSYLGQRVNVGPMSAGERISASAATVIQSVLSKPTSRMVDAVVLVVNGHDVVAVSDELAAKAVTEQILREYKTSVLQDASDIERIQFQETIETRRDLVPEETVRTVEEAVLILKHGTDQIATYIVNAGDTGWTIARSYNISLEELTKYNPGVDWHLMQIGQEINVTFKEPYIHTQSVSKRVVTESIPFTERVTESADLWPWQYEIVTPGVPGKRELTIREYREDGRVVKTEVIENVLLSSPKQQVARRGTKQVPAMGSGDLVFPVNGPLTSHFGPRWGTYHYGIDIAAPEGTKILAADSGMVVFRGWSGNYGNLVKIDHGNGMETWYAHLSGYNVKLGDTVGKGDVIGYVGNTGYSFGSHLHFEIHVDGKQTNPLNYYK